ncbi:MAG TPA: GNAT family N-acetyltransferase [Kofleriaceae bacterium]|nr:GNAT family N-acetyltransferase [Kofleriaceae bacterium]
MSELVRLRWHPANAPGVLHAIEPTAADIELHAAQLAVAYNDPYNAALMGNTEAMTAADVVTHYATMNASGARQFHLFVDDDLVGDADLRDIETGAGAAEFAFMIADRKRQGRGLGTYFALMIHHFAFAPPSEYGVGLERIYAAIVPANTGSRRVFEKLGYRIDDSAAARERADEPSDIVMVIDRATFVAQHQLSELFMAPY